LLPAIFGQPSNRPGQGSVGEKKRKAMHEMGIVMHLARTLDETAKENRITRIGLVTLQVGEVSGIMTDYFEECWDYFKTKSPYLRESRLIVESIPAITWCSGCRREYPTVTYGKECPYCHSMETWLQKGNECIIKEITAESAQ
jgi:hydrogenase nickel incorporation protein HypA/HybF